MSLKTELNDLADAAVKKLHDAEGLAMSERIRIEDAFAAARSAVSSLVEPAVERIETADTKRSRAKADKE